MEEFLDYLEEVAASGAWEDTDRVRVCRLKLQGAAASFVRNTPGLKGEISFELLASALRQRFRDPRNFEFYGRLLQDVHQNPKEGILDFADRCAGLGEKMGRPDLVDQEAKWWSTETERKVLEAFSRGLSGEIGKQILFARHSVLNEAVKHALEIEQALGEHQRARGVFSLEEEGESSREKRSIGQCCCQTGEPTIKAIRGNITSSGYSSRKGATCFRCEKRGHFARDCPQKTGLRDVVGERNRVEAATEATRVCFRCGLTGHYASHCRTPPQKKTTTEPSPNE